MKFKYAPLIAFIYITFSSAFVFSAATVGDAVEHVINFISPLIMFLVVIALFSEYKKSNIFSKLECKYIAIFYILITVIKYIYPVMRYWDQDFGSDYYTLFILELGINSAIGLYLLLVQEG